jgi:hypothetical protein
MRKAILSLRGSLIETEKLASLSDFFVFKAPSGNQLIVGNIDGYDVPVTEIAPERFHEDVSMEGIQENTLA